MHTLVGGASYYNLVGNQMANGQRFDPAAMNAAMLHVRLGTTVTVESLSSPGKTVSVTVTDRGPYEPGRIIDLTPAAFRALNGTLAAGVFQVKVTVP